MRLAALLVAIVLSLTTVLASGGRPDKKAILSSLSELLAKKGGKVDAEWRDALQTSISTLENQQSTSDATASAPTPDLRLKNYAPVEITAPGYKLPIVYVFTVSKVFCEYGLPEYIKYSLIQSVMSQSDAEVILVGNYQQCPKPKDAGPLRLPAATAGINQSKRG